MRGVRPLTKAEIVTVARSFSGRFQNRNRALFLMQYYTGRRISQTLALKLRDVINEQGEIVDMIFYRRETVKKKTQGERIPLHREAKKVLRVWVNELRTKGYIMKSHFLFQSNRADNSAMTRRAAYKVYSRAFKKAGLAGRLGTHSLRKAFAMQIFKRTGNNPVMAQRALGHQNLASTSAYLCTEEAVVQQVILNEL